VSPRATVIEGLGLGVVLFHPKNVPSRKMLRETAFAFGIRIGTSTGKIPTGYENIAKITMSISETEAACRRKRDISVNSYLNSIISRVPYLRLGPSTGLSYTLTRMKLKNMPKALPGKTLKQKTQAESEPEVQTSRFMVQEHHARRLHWDFRLEMDGVLKSWAVPKGVPTELRVKRLAVQVDDHPLSYFDFEGNIPEGQYGAGTVKVWDKGLYVLTLREPRKLHILLKGRKLEGDYRLINFKDRNWLLYRVA